MVDEDCGCLLAVSRAAQRAREGRQELRGAVEAARDGGVPWRRVAAVLGTTRQAAQERFGRGA